MEVEIRNKGQMVYTGELKERKFRTGSRGYHLGDKVIINGKEYQVNFLLIEIGSKK